MTQYEIHEAAQAFPLMDDERFSELKTDIQENGLRLPIILCDGKILDGRNRYKACQELGIEATFQDFKGNPWSYVWSLNGERRDIDAERRYLIWKFIVEKSASWQVIQQQIEDDANKKKSEIAINKNRKDNGTFEQSTSGTTCPTTGLTKEHQTRRAKVKASKTNMGAVKRGDTLAKKRPDLADAVRNGELASAAAHRQMKKDEVVSNLESVANKEQKEILGVYDVIIVDPPWPTRFIKRDTRPNQIMLEYPTMSLEEIQSIPLSCADNCHVWLWVTHKYLPTAFALLKNWNLKYVCTFVWHKPGGYQPYDLPQYNCEFAIYARRGNPKFIDLKAFSVCFDAPRGPHSEKPIEFYDMVRQVTAGRRLDMFSRRKIDGFDGWGKESE